MNLSKVFNTIDHVILIKKLDHWGGKGRNLLLGFVSIAFKWKNYLNKRKQFITYDNANTSFTNI